MKSDHEIELDVKDELQWDPNLDATDIAVSVKKGVVTLAGFVKNYADKYEAESAAKRVAGVLGVANDIEVRMPSVDERPDPEIARDAVAAIKSQLPISSENIKVIVKDGWVTLEGQVEWLPRSMPTASPSKRAAARSSSRGRFGRGSNAKRPSEPPGLRRASLKWRIGLS